MNAWGWSPPPPPPNPAPQLQNAGGAVGGAVGGVAGTVMSAAEKQLQEVRNLLSLPSISDEVMKIPQLIEKAGDILDDIDDIIEFIETPFDLNLPNINDDPFALELKTCMNELIGLVGIKGAVDNIFKIPDLHFVTLPSLDDMGFILLAKILSPLKIPVQWFCNNGLPEIIDLINGIKSSQNSPFDNINLRRKDSSVEGDGCDEQNGLHTAVKRVLPDDDGAYGFMFDSNPTMLSEREYASNTHNVASWRLWLVICETIPDIAHAICNIFSSIDLSKEAFPKEAIAFMSFCEGISALMDIEMKIIQFAVAEADFQDSTIMLAETNAIYKNSHNIIHNQFTSTRTMMNLMQVGNKDWMHVLTLGSNANNYYGETIDITADIFNAIFSISEFHIIKRECLECVNTHQLIYYRRFEYPESNTFDAYTYMKQWKIDTHNTLGTNFNLYSSLQDAISGINPWQHCTTPDAGVIGAFYDCAPEAAVTQTASLTPSPKMIFKNNVPGKDYCLQEDTDWGGTIWAFPCNTELESQQFEYDSTEQTLKVKSSGRCMDVDAANYNIPHGGRAYDGASLSGDRDEMRQRMIPRTCDGSNYQKWIFTAEGYIKNVQTNWCVDIHNYHYERNYGKARVDGYSCFGRANQLWGNIAEIIHWTSLNCENPTGTLVEDCKNTKFSIYIGSGNIDTNSVHGGNNILTVNRWKGTVLNDYIFSSSKNPINGLKNYAYEGTVFKILESFETGTKALYRKKDNSGTANDQMLTTNANEGSPDYVLDGIIGYCYETQVIEAVLLRRYQRGDNNRYVASISSTEQNTLVAITGTVEEDLCYVLPVVKSASINVINTPQTPNDVVNDGYKDDKHIVIKINPKDLYFIGILFIGFIGMFCVLIAVIAVKCLYKNRNGRSELIDKNSRN